ncbi:hypothetical protein [Mycolicibacterium conceptionense]|uniref:hypothetical protein n=1 Tax=Mycolicibacterium conceptionense TaxID=451644 RepID=UPI0010565459|nr:hypothetical protein [Mycolicibacterium conceptionense]
MGLALVAIIAVSIVGTVLVLRPDSGGGNGQQNTANSGSEFASANDTGPANIITEDPTCEAWVKIARDVGASAPKWNEQDYSVPASQWTPDQRSIFENRSEALGSAIKKVETLARQTPHRTMRELYGQYIVYGQALIDSIPNYSAADNYIVGASNRFSATLTNVCDAIRFRAAQESAPLVPTPPVSADVQGPGPSFPERFVSSRTDVCDQWIALAEGYDKDTAAWRALDTKFRASEWTPEQKAVMDAVAPVMSAYADDMIRLGQESRNAVWNDFSVFSAQYLRAYVQAIPTFTPNYTYMAAVSSYLSNAIYWACKAVS